MENAVLIDDKVTQTQYYEAQQSLVKALESAQFAHTLLDEVMTYLRPGVRESEIKEKTAALFEARGVERTWHQTYVRFGQHTLLTYRDKAPEDFVLGEDDIAFVDLGVVKEGVEGDAGRTLVTGHNAAYTSLQQASEAIFHESLAYWRRTQSTGLALYDYIHQLAHKMDVQFILDPAGHLIGDFPHRGWKHGLNNYPETVMPGCWIVEIQIADAQGRYGAFYENLLY